MLPFKLYLITDRKATHGKPLEQAVEAALQSGVKAVQLREKDWPARPLLNLAHTLRKRTLAARAKLLINGRLDIAMAAEADGLHIPENGLPIPKARRHFPDKLFGKSTHSLEKAVEAEQHGADFIVFGPVFDTPSKNGMMEPRGLTHLKQVAHAVKIPVFALGGVNPENTKACLENGAYGVAVISAVLSAEDIPRAVASFQQALGEL